MRWAVVVSSLMLLSTSCRRTVYVAPYSLTLPGKGNLVTGQLGDFTQTERTLSQAATGDTTPHESVVARVDERVLADREGPVFVRVTTGHYSAGDYYDSLFVRRADLRPIREHLAYPQRRIDKQFDYRDNAVHQTNVGGAADTTFVHEYTLPVYAFSEIETLIRSLPFQLNYSAILPLYSEGDDALELDSVAVVNDRAGKLWTVRFADPAIVAMYGVDASTRRIVSYYVTSRKTHGHAWKEYSAP
jgi:hypothetical protein